MTNVKKKIIKHLRIILINNAIKNKIAKNTVYMNYTLKKNALQNIQNPSEPKKLADPLIIKKDIMIIDVKI